MAPHTEHARVEGNHRSTRANVRPCRRALYSSMADERRPARVVHARASRVRASPDTARSSTYTAWFSRTIVVDSLCSQSRRVSADPGVAARDLAAGALPVARALLAAGELPLAARSFAAALRAMRGRRPSGPSDSTAKCVRPRSIPTSRRPAGAAASGASTTNEAWYRPAASTVTVTETPRTAASRDQRTGTSPIPGSRSRPAAVTRNRAALVNRIDCARSRFGTGTGARPAFGPSGCP